MFKNKALKNKEIKSNTQNKTDMIEFHKLLNKLIKDGKIQFSFYNNHLLSLDLLSSCYNSKSDIIELDFRDIMAEHISELREIMNTKKSY